MANGNRWTDLSRLKEAPTFTTQKVTLSNWFPFQFYVKKSYVILAHENQTCSGYSTNIFEVESWMCWIVWSLQANGDVLNEHFLCSQSFYELRLLSMERRENSELQLSLLFELSFWWLSEINNISGGNTIFLHFLKMTNDLFRLVNDTTSRWTSKYYELNSRSYRIIQSIPSRILVNASD